MTWMGMKFFPKNALLWGRAGKAFPPCLTLNHLLGHPQGEETGRKPLSLGNCLKIPVRLLPAGGAGQDLLGSLRVLSLAVHGAGPEQRKPEQWNRLQECHQL